MADLDRLERRLRERVAKAGENALADWREACALLAGHLGDQAGAWVERLIAHEDTLAIGLEALGTAESLPLEVVERALDKTSTWEQYATVLLHLTGRLGRGAETIAPLERRGRALAEAMRKDAERRLRIDLWHVLDALERLGATLPEHAPRARAAVDAIVDELAPSEPIEPGDVRGLPFWCEVPGCESFLMGYEGVEVSLNRFWIARTQVTRGLYRSFDRAAVEERDRSFDYDYTMNQITWFEADLCTRWLDRFCRLPEVLERVKRVQPERSWRLRLPSEAQWEYACRVAGSSSSAYVNGDTEHDLAEVGWYSGNRSELQRVATRSSSEVPELIDMLSNCREWCADCSVGELPGGRDPLVSAGVGVDARRVLRGGGVLNLNRPGALPLGRRLDQRPDIYFVIDFNIGMNIDGCGVRPVFAPSPAH